MNKFIYIYKTGKRLCDIAKEFNTTVNKILIDSNIQNIEQLGDFTPLIINLNCKAQNDELLSCDVEKRGCNGCYYIK